MNFISFINNPLIIFIIMISAGISIIGLIITGTFLLLRLINTEEDFNTLISTLKKILWNKSKIN